MYQSGIKIDKKGGGKKMEEIECRNCKYFEDPFCHYVGQGKEGLAGGCPYGKELGTLEDLFGGE